MKYYTVYRTVVEKFSVGIPDEDYNPKNEEANKEFVKIVVDEYPDCYLEDQYITDFKIVKEET